MEDITRWREYMNLNEFYLTSERSKWSSEILLLPQEYKIHIFFFYYNDSDNSVFHGFPKITEHFPHISERSPNHVRRSHERCGTFFEKNPKIT